jgi:hypothetical protein
MDCVKLVRLHAVYDSVKKIEELYSSSKRELQGSRDCREMRRGRVYIDDRIGQEKIRSIRYGTREK